MAPATRSSQCMPACTDARVAIQAAASAQPAFTNTLFTLNRLPRAMNTSALLSASGAMNCGTKARKKIATLGLSAFVRNPPTNTFHSGSADVLESLGVNINLKPEQIARCIEEVGIGFMFAPNHHPAMKNVAPVRKELGVRTIFNILGPLTNPASAPNILMGVFHPDLVGIQVRALQRLGAQHAVVVYGRDGMDEVSLGAATMVGELKNGEIAEYDIHPEDFGLPMASNRSFRVETPEQSRAILTSVLDNEGGPARDIVVFNAGAALYAANLADSIQAGIAKAHQAVESGAAKAKLQQLVQLTRSFA